MVALASTSRRGHASSCASTWRRGLASMWCAEYMPLPWSIQGHTSLSAQVSPPGQPFPFADGSFDLVITTSTFEHDPMFWMTIREMARVVRLGGFVYVNAPSAGFYHGYPDDNYRFYRGAAGSLAFWWASNHRNWPRAGSFLYACSWSQFPIWRASGVAKHSAVCQPIHFAWLNNTLSTSSHGSTM